MNYFRFTLALCSLLISSSGFAQFHIAFDYRPGTLSGGSEGAWTKFENPAINQVWINSQRGFVLGESDKQAVENYLVQQVEFKKINNDVKKEVENLLNYFTAEQQQRAVIKDFVPDNLRPNPLPVGVEQSKIDSALQPLWQAVETEDLRGASQALSQTRKQLQTLTTQERRYAEAEINRLFTYPTGQLKNLPYLNTSPVTFNLASNSTKLVPFTTALNGQQSVEAALRKEILARGDKLGAGSKLRLQRESLVSRRVTEALKIEEFRTHYFNQKSEFPNDVTNQLENEDQDSARSEIYKRSQEIIRNNPKIYKEIFQAPQSIDDQWLEKSAQLSLCLQSGNRCEQNTPTGDPSSPIKKLYDNLTSLHETQTDSSGIKDTEVRDLSNRLVDFAHEKLLGDSADSSFFVDLAKQVTDMGLGLVPVLGTAKDFVELCTGMSTITGESLDITARSIMAVSVAIDFVSFGVGGRITKLALEESLNGLKTFIRTPIVEVLASKLISSASKLGASSGDEFLSFVQSFKFSSAKSIENVEQITENIWKSDSFKHAIASTSSGRPMFYVRESGEAVPSTAYKYLDSNSPDITNILHNGTLPERSAGMPAHYGTFNKFENTESAMEGLQLAKRPDGSPLNNARYRIEYDTQQIVNDLSIPNGKWGQADYLEPFVKDFPEFGEGGATQVVFRSTVQVKEVVDLLTGEIIYMIK